MYDKSKNEYIIQYWPKEPNSKPLPKQLEAHKADYKFRMLSGAVRAGKSLWGCHEGIKLSFKWPGNTGAIVRSTLAELKRTTEITFFEIFECNPDQAINPLFKKWNKSDQHLRFINGSNIYFIGIENWNILKSLELGWVFVEEGIDIKDEALKFLRTRLNKKLPAPDYKRYFFTATNPGDENHILYKWFIKPPETEIEKKERKDFFCLFTTSYDNIYQPEDYRQEFEYWKADEEFYNRYVLGKWGRFKGLVYKEYDEQVHLVQEKNYPEFSKRIKELYLAHDFGYTNPSATLFLGLTGDKEIIQIDEIYETEKTNTQIRALIKEKLEANKIPMTLLYADPEEPGSIKEFDDNGIPAMAAKNDIEEGIKKVKEFLALRGNKKPGYYIFERCIHTRKEYGLYRRPAEKEYQNKSLPELPIDKNNHALSALRYFCYTHFYDDRRLQTYGGKEPGSAQGKHERPLDRYREQKRQRLHQNLDFKGES